MAFKTKLDALEIFLSAMKSLREEKILINKKDFTCQIGEWLVEMLYDGKRSENGIQKGWDIDLNGKHIQVKAHAKAESNNNRWSAVEKYSTETIDELIIVVFTQDYKLKEFYKIPWEIAVGHIKLRGKEKPRYEINWRDIKEYKVEKENLPKPEIVSFFT